MKCPNCNIELKLVGDSREIKTSKIELQHAEIKKEIDKEYTKSKGGIKDGN